jgi:hypothetical protein
MKLLLLLLLPSFSLAQTAAFLEGSTLHNRDLKTGYGLKITVAQGVYKNTYVGLGMGYTKYESLNKPVLPLTLNVLYAPKQTKSGVAVMTAWAIGYSFYDQAKVKGWFYNSLGVGIKTTNKKLCPFALIGITTQKFALYDAQDKISEVPVYSSLTFRLGLAF